MRQHEVKAAIEQLLIEHFQWLHLGDEQHLWQELTRTRHGPGQDLRRKRSQHADTHLRADTTGQAQQVLLGQIDLGQHAVGVLNEAQTRHSGHHAFGGALKQNHLQLVLQLRKRPGGSRLGGVQDVCTPTQVELESQNAHQAQLLERQHPL